MPRRNHLTSLSPAAIYGLIWLGFGVGVLLPRGLAQEVRPPSAAEGSVSVGGKFSPASATKPTTTPSTSATAAAQAAVRVIDGDQIQLGLLKINRKARTLTIPAQVKIRQGPVEYALVHETGKAHEALFVTTVSPTEVHIAALLLDAPSSAPRLEVRWPKNGPEARMALADLITITEPTHAEAFTTGAWYYGGSVMQGPAFAAQIEGSIVALMGDPVALVNHRAAQKLERDDVFHVKTDALPPVGVPVQLILTFPPKS